jgi:hypothetical protein
MSIVKPPQVGAYLGRSLDVLRHTQKVNGSTLPKVRFPSVHFAGVFIGPGFLVVGYLSVPRPQKV